LASGVDGEVIGANNGPTFKNPSPPSRGDNQPTLNEQIFDVAMAEREVHIGPNGTPK
jgi:hypothetical protein